MVLALLLGVALVVIGCSNGSGAAPTAAPAILTLTTNPNPPTSGDVEIIATVTDANGRPLDDAKVFVSGSHTDMKGMSMNGNATARGSGQYALKANFGMGGSWKITVQVKKPPLDITREFTMNFK